MWCRKLGILKHVCKVLCSFRYVYIASLRPHWMSLVSIFEPNTWLLFCGISILTGTVWYFLGLSLPESAPHKRLSTCLLNSWSVFLGISTHNRPQLTSTRIFFIMIALYGLNVTTIYTSKLITVFTSPVYQDQIDSIQEVINTGLPYGTLNFNIIPYVLHVNIQLYFNSQVDVKIIMIGSKMIIQLISFLMKITIHRMHFCLPMKTSTISEMVK